MTSPRRFFLAAVAVGLVVGWFIQWLPRADVRPAQVWLDNLTSPVAAWMRYRDCARVAEGLTDMCRRAHALADPLVVAAATALDQEQSAMQQTVQAWQARSGPVFRYVVDARSAQPQPMLAHAAGTITLLREEGDEAAEGEAELRMATRLPVAGQAN